MDVASGHSCPSLNECLIQRDNEVQAHFCDQVMTQLFEDRK